MISLFDRYFFKELFKLFFASLFATFFVFILIDTSTHMKIFIGKELTWKITFAYLASHLSLLADILLPLAFTLSLIKVLTQSMAKNEITALLTSAISTRRILRPFLISGLIVSALLFVNAEWLYPTACRFHDQFTTQFFHKNEKSFSEVQGLRLKDRTLLIYKKFDPDKRVFTELFWIKNPDELYRMEKLAVNEKAQGHSVDHFLRNERGELTKKDSFSTLAFDEIHFEKKLLRRASDPTSLSLSHLASLLSFPYGVMKADRFSAKVTSLFYYRLSSTLLPLLAVLAIAPFCLRFSRIQKTFLLFALSLSSLFVFFTLTRSLLIIAEAQVIPPFWALLSPYFLAFGIFVKRYGSL